MAARKRIELHFANGHRRQAAVSTRSNEVLVPVRMPGGYGYIAFGPTVQRTADDMEIWMPRSLMKH